MKTARWTNWAGNQSCEPAALKRPDCTEHVADLVAKSYLRGERVKVAASGHSFTAAALTEGLLLSIENLSGIIDVNLERGEVTVGGGTRLHDINNEMDAIGLAFPNLGDIDVQTAAGAISTATHGTGALLGNIATQVVGLELVTGAGEVIECDEQNNPELLKVARVGVGALGVITRVTFKAVPSFNLKVEERGRKLDEMLDSFPQFVTENDHAEFFWFPGSSWCLVKENNRTDEPIDPPSRARYFMDKIVAENVAFDLVCRTARRFPQTRPKLGKIVAAVSSERALTDKSFKIFASPRHVKFMEMEYSIPREALPEALAKVRDVANKMPVPPMFPVEVRVSAADDIPLSTGYGRDSAWIAVHRYKNMEFHSYFKAVEAVMNEYDGRPHWGKYHYQTAATLKPRYPEWDTFAETRATLDPKGTFANAYTDIVLGPVGD